MSRALSSRTIVVWAVGLVVAAAVAVTLLWVFLGGDDPADARRLDAIRTASSLVIGAGGAAALLLAARRQRYVELDLEQKEHDANERRMTELYGKAADQLGSDKAPVRLAGVYALERLAQDEPRHRQTVVNVLCAYLRMPFEPGTDPATVQERQVRGSVQEVLETHLQPATRDRFWPGLDLNLNSAVLEFFWLRDCEAGKADFRYVTFHGVGALRGTRFTGRAYFQGVRFAGTADLRGIAFERGFFQNARFEGDVDFGNDPPSGRLVNLTDAVAVAAADRRWPAGWQDEPDPEVADQLRVVPQNEADHSIVT